MFEVSANVSQRTHWVVRGLCIAGASIALTALAGWWLGLPQLHRVFSGLPSMQPQTAMCVLLLAVATWCHAPAVSKPTMRFAQLAAIAVAIVCGITLTMHLVQFGALDHVERLYESLGGSSIRLSSLIASCCLMLLAFALVYSPTKAPLASQTFGLLCFSVVGIVTLAYFLNVPALWELGPGPGMSIPTTAAISLLLVAQLILCRQAGVCRLVAERGVGATMARSLAPVTFLAPGVLGYVYLQAQREGFVQFHIGLTAYVALIAYVGTLAVLFVAMKLQRTVQAHESQLRTFVRYLPTSVAMFDRNLRYIITSQRWLQDYKLEEQNLIGRSHYDVFPEIPDRWKEDHRRGLAGESLHSDEDLFIRADGLQQWLKWEVRPWFTADGSIGGIIMETEDITLRKQVEDKVRESEARFRELANCSPMGVFHTDINGRCLWVNRRWEDIAAMPCNSAVGEGWISALHSEDRERFLFEWTSALSDRHPLNVEVRYLQADGDIRWVQMHVNPIRSDGSKVVGFVGSVEDVTEQRSAESALRESEERFALAVNGMNDGIWDWNLESGHYYRSERCSDLLRLDDQTPATFEDSLKTVHPDDRLAVLAAIDMHLKHREAFDIEHRISCGDGREHWVRNRGQAIWNDEGKAIRMVGSISDITRQKEYEATLRNYNQELWQIKDILERQAHELAVRTEELDTARTQAEHASRIKSDFLANMSHEIRTPMSAILGYADLLLNPNQTPEERADCIRTIRRNGEHLLTVINDILDISKIEAGKLLIEQICCNPAKIVSEVESLLRVRASDKGIDFKIEFPTALPRNIRSDPTRLRQILLNLVSNAIKFTHHGGVTIRTVLMQEGGTAKPRLRFDVIDTGIGISQQQQDRLFQAFTQADESMSRRYGGTGLGLAISRRLAEMLGGQLLVCSQEGEGTTFSLLLPLMELDENDLSEHPLESVPQEPAIAVAEKIELRGRILLAEDGPDNQRLISHHLRTAGAEVQIVGNGRAAVEAASTAQLAGQPFDLIIMDIQMPEMDGYAAAAEIIRRKIPTPMIALTAHAMEADRRKCLDAGFTDYQTKPIDRARLLRATASHLRSTVSAAQTTANEPQSVPAAQRLRSAYHNDPEIRGILDEFIASLPNVVSESISLLRQRDLDNLRRVMHQMKGAGGGYGFDDITQRAADAEQAIKLGQSLDQVQRNVEALVGMLRSVDGYDELKETVDATESTGH